MIRWQTSSKWICLAIAAATLLAYANSFDASFQFDDYPNVVDSAAVREPTLAGLLRSSRSRLLPIASLAMNYRLGGETTTGYHVFNFAIHLLATLAVFALVGALCDTPRLRGTWLAAQRQTLAAVTAFLFACHPLQVQAVTYVVQRTSSMVALFYIASVFFYARGRNAQLGSTRGRAGRSFAAAALCALLAFFSKENSASLPAAILLVELAFYPGEAAARRLLRTAPFLLLVLLLPLTWYAVGTRPGAAPGSDAPLWERGRYLWEMLTFRAFPRGEISPLQYFLTQCVVLPRYLLLVLAPSGLTVDHDVSIERGVTPLVIAGLLFLTACLALGLLSLRRRPLVGFAVLWIFITLSVESSFFPIQDPMVEHRMYLAMPGVCLLAALAFTWLLLRRRRLALVMGAAAAVALCALTYQRNQVWRTPLSLWTDAMAKSPGKARPYANAGVALLREKNFDEAIPLFCKALRVDPTYKLAQANLNVAVEQQLDRDAEQGVVHLQEMRMLPDGSLEAEPEDPCAGAPKHVDLADIPGLAEELERLQLGGADDELVEDAAEDNAP